MGDVIWEEPPTLPQRVVPSGRVWPKRLTPLMEHPLRWAVVHEFKCDSTAASTASQLRRGTVVSVPEGKWEFAARGRKVYARYLGEA